MLPQQFPVSRRISMTHCLFCSCILCMLVENAQLVLSLSSLVTYFYQAKSSTLNQRRMESSPPPPVARPSQTTLRKLYGGPSCKEQNLKWHPATWHVPLHVLGTEHTARQDGTLSWYSDEEGSGVVGRQQRHWGEEADCPVLIQVTGMCICKWPGQQHPLRVDQNHSQAQTPITSLPGLKLR